MSSMLGVMKYMKNCALYLFCFRHLS